MSKVKYFKGFLRNIKNLNVSKLSLIDDKSTVHKTTIVYRNTKIIASEIDAYSYVSPGSELLYANIRKYCSIGQGCYIGLPEHSLKNISSSPIFTSKINALKQSWTSKNSFCEYNEVKIGNDVWIGNRVMIKGGIVIGDGAVIGAGSIVTKNVPPFAVVAGAPTKIIKYRFDDSVIKILLMIRWWDWPVEFLRRNEIIEIFSNELNSNSISLLMKYKDYIDNNLKLITK